MRLPYSPLSCNVIAAAPSSFPLPSARSNISLPVSFNPAPVSPSVGTSYLHMLPEGWPPKVISSLLWIFSGSSLLNRINSKLLGIWALNGRTLFFSLTISLPTLQPNWVFYCSQKTSSAFTFLWLCSSYHLSQMTLFPSASAGGSLSIPHTLLFHGNFHPYRFFLFPSSLNFIQKTLFRTLLGHLSYIKMCIPMSYLLLHVHSPVQ